MTTFLDVRARKLENIRATMAQLLTSALAQSVVGAPALFTLIADRNRAPYNPLQQAVESVISAHFTPYDVSAGKPEQAYNLVVEDLKRRATFKKQKKGAVYVLMPTGGPALPLPTQAQLDAIMAAGKGLSYTIVVCRHDAAQHEPMLSPCSSLTGAPARVKPQPLEVGKATN